MWMTIQVVYEPGNPIENKQLFKQYLSAAPARMFKCDGKIFAVEDFYFESLQILTDRIREFNAKFICDKSVSDSPEFCNSL